MFKIKVLHASLDEIQFPVYLDFNSLNIQYETLIFFLLFPSFIVLINFLWPWTGSCLSSWRDAGHHVELGSLVSNYIPRIKLSSVQRTSLASDNMMDNCPIHTRLNIDVAIGLDLARTLPSSRAKNVITESKRLFIHVIVMQAASCQSSLHTLPFCSYFPLTFSHRLPSAPLFVSLSG